MKTSNYTITIPLIILVAAISINLSRAQTVVSSVPATGVSSQATPYAVIERGANYRVWQQLTYTTNRNGQIVTNVQSYTELATGLHHWVNGQWVESKEEIDLLPNGDGAAATNGQHQVYFPADIYNGRIRLITPDGQLLQSRPVGLSYDDGSNTVLIAILTNSVGGLTGSNQVVYPDAFDGIKADIQYTYRKSGFEQDIILLEQPPAPASLGLNPDTTRLEVLTEFFNPPPPTVTATTVATDIGDLENDQLNFGAMQMMQGRAFLLGINAVDAGVLVNKQWLNLDGRQFLVEEVPTASIADELIQLPRATPTIQTSRLHSPLYDVSAKRLLPAKHLVKTAPAGQRMPVAKAHIPSRGLVLDYVTVTSQANFTFQGDTTYYISGAVNLTSTNNTFEGGAIIKYATGASVSVAGINWRAGPYRPVIFTAKDDNSVGESFGTGNPSGYYANPALSISASSQTLSSFRMAYAQQAISTPSASINFYDGQFVNCSNGLTAYSATNLLRNVLFTKVTTDFNSLSLATIDVQNGTFANSTNLSTVSSSATLEVTNCILANVTNLNGATAPTLNGGYNGFYNSPNFGANQTTNMFYPFQSVGAGNYYYTNGCVFTNAGTGAIDPVLLAELQNRTSYAPIAYTNITVTNTTWNLQAARDTSSNPNLGYHYDPIDYAIGNVAVRGTLTLTNNVAVAAFWSHQSGQWQFVGFNIYGGGDTLLSIGTPQIHNQICTYQAVQEQPIIWGTYFQFAPKYLMCIGSSPSTPETLEAHFTDFNAAAGMASGYTVCGTGMQLLMRDCSMGPGWFSCDQFDFGLTNQCINNLFERTQIAFLNADGANWVFFFNNLLRNGYVEFDDMYPHNTVVRDNLFDNDSWEDYPYNFTYDDHNGYLKTTVLPDSGGHDVTLTNFNYAIGPLGNYYQGSTNLLHVGSTTADQLSLYHYTVQTNLVNGYEIKETNSTVSIGFHYVATDASGNPLDSNGDGIPDYLSDANGNGVVDSGEIGWNIVGDLGLKVLITQPRNNSIIP